MEGDCKPLFTLPASRDSWRSRFFSQLKRPLLLTEQAENYQAENCRASAASLEFTPCTEVYNEFDIHNEQVENVSPPGPTFNGESTVGSSSGHTNTVGRVLPVVAAFAVQCANCLKWRVMPSKAKYEEIRECILDRPFFCEDACSWRPNASCEDPADIVPQEEFVWALDKPNISAPPPGWNRDFVIRSRGSSKFGDIYYISPCGKKLRSMVEVRSFLSEHPHYVLEGARLDRFSYKIPKPLFDGYVGERRTRCGEADADGPRKMRGSLNNKINTTQARREHGESSSRFDNAHFDGSGCTETDKSDIRGPSYPQFARKKRSTRMRPTAVVTNWKLSNLQ